MQTAIISGLFAFIGALLALYAQRRTMSESWLLQKRSENFAKFLIDLQEHRNEQLSFDDSQPEKNNYSLDKIYTSANIVCLYLPEDSRSEFKSNFDNYMKFKPDFSGVTGDFKQLIKIHEPQHQCEKNIQRIFENNLKCTAWRS
jgi:hypothetical protein